MAEHRKPELTLSKLVGLKTLVVQGNELNYSDFILNLNLLNEPVVLPTADFSSIAKQKNIKSLEVFITGKTIDRFPELETFSNF